MKIKTMGEYFNGMEAFEGDIINFDMTNIPEVMPGL